MSSFLNVLWCWLSITFWWSKVYISLLFVPWTKFDPMAIQKATYYFRIKPRSRVSKLGPCGCWDLLDIFLIRWAVISSIQNSNNMLWQPEYCPSIGKSFTTCSKGACRTWSLSCLEKTCSRNHNCQTQLLQRHSQVLTKAFSSFCFHDLRSKLRVQSFHPEFEGGC